jgi:FAD-dependent urate hydroxylase
MFDLNVVIVGGGIAGCATGIMLRRAGFSVQLYERAEEILPVGAAISVWSNGVMVLNRLGLGKQVAATGGDMRRMVYRSHTGQPLLDLDLTGIYREVGERCYPTARGELQQMLMEQLLREGGVVTLGKTLSRIEPLSGGRVRAVFEDGSASAAADLLVGADGTRSTVRKHVLQRDIPLVYHYTNWNGLVPASEGLGTAHEWVQYVGQGCRAATMPVGGGRCYFFIEVPLPEDAPAPARGTEAVREELLRIFRGWPEPVQRLIRAIDVARSCNRIPICDHDPLPVFSRGPVVLVGDAAHATTPTLGQGGCQALEDAEVLGQLLMTTNVSVQDALERYAQHRRSRVHSMVLKARERARTLYPRNDEDMRLTQAWYRQLGSGDKAVGDNIISGMTANLRGGPWPARL